MFEEAKKLVDFQPSDSDHIMQKVNENANAGGGGRRRAAMVANKKAAQSGDDGNSDNYMDYLLTVAEERHRGHLVSKAIDIRYSVKESYQKFFGKNNEPEDCQEDFEIAPTLGIKGKTKNL